MTGSERDAAESTKIPPDKTITAVRADFSFLARGKFYDQSLWDLMGIRDH